MRRDRGSRATVPGPQTDDHHRTTDQVQANRHQQRATTGDYDADTQENQPPQAEY